MKKVASYEDFISLNHTFEKKCIEYIRIENFSIPKSYQDSWYEEFKKFAQMLSRSRSVKTLEITISENRIHAPELKVLAKALNSNLTLEVLDIDHSNDRFNQKAIQELVKSTTISYLKI